VYLDLNRTTNTSGHALWSIIAVRTGTQSITDDRLLSACQQFNNWRVSGRSREHYQYTTNTSTMPRSTSGLLDSFVSCCSIIQIGFTFLDESSFCIFYLTCWLGITKSIRPVKSEKRCCCGQVCVPFNASFSKHKLDHNNTSFHFLKAGCSLWCPTNTLGWRCKRSSRPER